MTIPDSRNQLLTMAHLVPQSASPDAVQTLRASQRLIQTGFCRERGNLGSAAAEQGAWLKWSPQNIVTTKNGTTTPIRQPRDLFGVDVGNRSAE